VTADATVSRHGPSEGTMARLVPSNPAQLALVSSATGGTANFTVETAGSTPKVEIWERVLPFTPGPTPPPFTFGGGFAADTPVSRPVPTGGVYQVRLFRENQGNSLAEGDLLGALDFPCVRRGARVNFLTRCASMPQVDITLGGTFVSMAFATNVPTRARMQVGVTPPGVNGAGFPFFAPQDVVASAVTAAPKLLSKATLVDELFQPDTNGHVPMTTNQTLLFVIFAWDASGAWDFVWNTTGVAPATPPESIRTLKRVVDVRLHKLYCLDDSDDLSTGEATFKFIVKHATGTEERSLDWDPMDTLGQPKFIPGNTVSVHIDHPNAAGEVTVRIEGEEDDSGSIPPDDNDRAATHGLVGGDPLPFPVGELKERVDDVTLVFFSERRTYGELLSFSAEVIYSVHYI
jgi:hypothetical protein